MTRPATITQVIRQGDTPSAPPRYVPGPSRSPTPLDMRPLSECDTLPIPPAVVWRPSRYRRHSRLYWLVRDLGWWASEQWDIARFETGWAGQIAVMVLCAAAVCAVALAVVLWQVR